MVYVEWFYRGQMRLISFCSIKHSSTILQTHKQHTNCNIVLYQTVPTTALTLTQYIYTMCQTTILVLPSKQMTKLSRRKDDYRTQSLIANAEWKQIVDDSEKKQILCSMKLLTLLRKDLVGCILSDQKEQQQQQKQQQHNKKLTPKRTTPKRRKLGHGEPRAQ